MGFELLCLWGMVGLSLGAVVQAGRLLGRRLGAAAAVLATVLLGRLAWAFAVKDWSFAYVADNTRSGVGPLLRVAGLWAGPQGSLLLWTVLLAGAAALHAARRPAAVTGHGRAATGLWVLPAVAAVWATTLTRIGVIESVHAFADRPALRLALLVVAGAVSLVALVAVAQTRPVVALPVSGAGPWPPGAAVGAWWCWQPPPCSLLLAPTSPDRGGDQRRRGGGTIAARVEMVELAPGETGEVAGVELTHQTIELATGPVISEAIATVEAGGGELVPRLVSYRLRGVSTAEVASRFDVFDEIQVVLIDGDAAGARYRVNHLPRVGLVWLGGAVLVIGLAAQPLRRLRASSSDTVDGASSPVPASSPSLEPGLPGSRPDGARTGPEGAPGRPAPGP